MCYYFLIKGHRSTIYWTARNINYVTAELLTPKRFHIGHRKAEEALIYVLDCIHYNKHSYLGAEANTASLRVRHSWLNFVVSHRLTVNKEPI